MVPSISYVEGTMFYSARHRRFGQNRHVRKAQDADRPSDAQDTTGYPARVAPASSEYPHRSSKRRRHAS